MRCLHIMPYPPVPQNFGGAIRIFHLLKNLALRHDVTVLTFGDASGYYLMREAFGPSIRAIHLVPKNWSKEMRRFLQLYSHLSGKSFFYHLLRSKKMQDAVNQILNDHDFDMVQVEFAQMGIFDFGTSALKVLDAHNVEYDNFRRIRDNTHSLLRKFHYHREYRKFFQEEISTCRKFDGLFVTSERDKELIESHTPGVPKFVLPNGVDTSYFQPPGESSPEPWSLVFTGLMSYVPNSDGILYFLDEILPLIQQEIPQIRIYIVGRKPPKELLKRASTRVVVTGDVADVRPYISNASVYVVPLRMGGGTRLKVVEALAMKKPIVTTSIGCEGINVIDNESVLIRDEPRSFAEGVIELMYNAELCRRLVRNGYELVKQCYDWSLIGELQEQYYQQLRKRATERIGHLPLRSVA